MAVLSKSNSLETKEFLKTVAHPSLDLNPEIFDGNTCPSPVQKVFYQRTFDDFCDFLGDLAIGVVETIISMCVSHPIDRFVFHASK